MGSHPTGRRLLRLVQFLRVFFSDILFGDIVVEFLQQLLGIVVIERQFVRFQQRIVQFVRFVVFVGQQFIGQQLVGIFGERIFRRRFIRQRTAELRDDL